MTAPCALQMTANDTVDCAVMRGFGSLANARFNKNGPISALIRHNSFARFRPVGEGKPGVWLKSTKAIKRGEELFSWYGAVKYCLQKLTRRAGLQMQPITGPAKTLFQTQNEKFRLRVQLSITQPNTPKHQKRH